MAKNMKKATIYTIAKEAGLSVATISRYFNNTNLVKDSTRRRIQDISNKYEYEPSKIASAITTKKTKTFALILPSFKEPPFMDLISGAEYELSQRGYCLNVFNARQSLEREIEIVKIIDNRSIDGVIFSGVYGNKNDKIFITEMLKKNIPCIMVDRIIPKLDIPSVSSNDYLGGKIAANYLIENKHKNIGIITYNRSVYIFNQRVKGFLSKLNKMDLKISFIIDIPLEFKKIEDNILKRRAEIINSGVTALFTTADSLSIILMRMLQEANLKIPEEMSVMGYDNIVYSNLVHPRLSTIHHDMYQMGRIVADNLIYRVENGVYKEMNNVIDPTLVVRNSVRRL